MTLAAFDYSNLHNNKNFDTILKNSTTHIYRKPEKPIFTLKIPVRLKGNRLSREFKYKGLR